MRKKTIALIVTVTCLILLFPTLSPGAEYSGYQTVGVTVDGTTVVGEVPAIVMDGRTLVPLRVVSEALGASVSWDASTRTVHISSPSFIKGTFPAGRAQDETYNGYPTVNVSINSNPISGEIPAIVMNGRTLVPLRLVSESLGASVTWDASSRTVFIVSHFTDQGKVQDVVKIGFIAPISGDLKPLGQSVNNGFSLALEQAGMKAGDLRVQYVVADDKNFTVDATAAAEKLINQDEVQCIIGSVTAKSSVPISEVAQSSNIPMITPSATDPRVTVGDGSRKDYVFRACFIDPYQGETAARFALCGLNARTAAVLYDKGSDYSMTLAEQFKTSFEAAGGQVTTYNPYISTDFDFKDSLSQIAAQQVDVLFLPDGYQKVALIGKQARELGVKAVFLGGDGWGSDKLNMTAMEGGFFVAQYYYSNPDPACQLFAKNYQAEYGAPPDAMAALGYDAANLMLNAIKTAGSSDPARIRAALQSTRDYPGATGSISFDSSGNPIKPAVIVQVKNGGLHYYTTINP